MKRFQVLVVPLPSSHTKVWPNYWPTRPKSAPVSDSIWRAVCVKILSEDYGSGTNQMGGFVGGAPFLQMADFWTWRIL